MKSSLIIVTGFSFKYSQYYVYVLHQYPFSRYMENNHCILHVRTVHLLLGLSFQLPSYKSSKNCKTSFLSYAVPFLRNHSRYVHQPGITYLRVVLSVTLRNWSGEWTWVQSFSSFRGLVRNLLTYLRYQIKNGRLLTLVLSSAVNECQCDFVHSVCIISRYYIQNYWMFVDIVYLN